MCFLSAGPHPPTAVLTAGLRTLLDPPGFHGVAPLKRWGCHPSTSAPHSSRASDQELQESARGGGLRWVDHRPVLVCDVPCRKVSRQTQCDNGKLVVAERGAEALREAIARRTAR